MKIPADTTVPISEWSKLIDEWIFDEKHRDMLKLNLLDGWTYDQVATKYGMSIRQIARIIPKLQKQLFQRLS